MSDPGRNARRAERASKGLCIYCGAYPPNPGTKGCEGCQAKLRTRQSAYIQRNPKTNEEYRKRIRTEVLTAYGGKCVCCGEWRERFLTVDHKNKDGAQERRALYGTKEGSSYSFYLKIRREGFPDRYQVLCWNCNFASFYGECPHRSEHHVQGKERDSGSVPKTGS